tara:strand:- start:1948 stop:2934 length:987 start_codon:yes stop_codon:yes gene_type:complete
MDTYSENTTQGPNSMQKISNTISNTYNDVSQSIKGSIDGFSNQSEAGEGASVGFLQSNTIIAKFSFLMLIIIIFIVLLNLGILLIQYFTTTTDSPYLYYGMKSGATEVVRTQDPTNSESILVKRSNNQSSGIEFTWSTWIFINELPGAEEVNKYQHIFNKGPGNISNEKGDGIDLQGNGPGLYIKPFNNDVKSAPSTGDIASLRVIMTTNANGNDRYIDIDDIPIKKWVNIIIRMQNTVMDVYVNGTISGRLTLTDVPIQNYYNVNITKNGGFNGNLSNLRYYDYAMNIFEITKIVSNGPNLDTDAENKGKLQKNYNYLSTSWYTAKV